MKYLITLIFLVFPLGIFASTTDISCDEVILTLSSDNKMSWEEFDSNWVRGNYGTDTNKWELRYWEPVFSNSAICMYTWKITSTNVGNSPNEAIQYYYQHLIYNKDGELKYYAQRPITKSLIQQENAVLKKATEEALKKKAIENQNLTINTTANTSIKNLEEFNKSVEEAKKVLEQKSQSETIVIPAIPTSISTKKMSAPWQKKAALLKKRIVQLEKQLAQLRKQLDEVK